MPIEHKDQVSCAVKDQHYFHLTNGRHPQEFLNQKSNEWNLSLHNKEYATKMDEHDPIGDMRKHFHYPKLNDLPNVDKSRVNPDDECTYLCGQSLGLMPKRAENYVLSSMNDWAKIAVYGHFLGSNPWAKCDYPCIPQMSLLVGGHMKEVGVMNQLSTNLHFMMMSFYQPKGNRYKILYEERAFPSDQYAINSQIELRGYDPNESKVIVKSREGETYIRTKDILDVLKREGESIALILIGGVHYYTGQLFDIETITRAAHEQGCYIGWDLAHAVGNIPLKLHEWNVDFAVWCTYKYLNSGAGCIGGLFIHSNHFQSKLFKLNGWWGNRDSTRFAMADGKESVLIDTELGANGYRISNPSIHQCATLAASLEVFEEVGIEQLRSKSIILTQYLQYLLDTEINNDSVCTFKTLTPTDPRQRGAQISIRPNEITAQQLHDEMEKTGVVIDIRDDIIRIAPAPLYNSFYDVYKFITILKEAIITIRALRLKH
ncbi:unnamed protein product [Didymodactylos carnosus]|uniref:Kynureninase n=1 Tax=Didymodactylos carnosus TaxID=1234261 RepID=A0A814PNM2_9BILA|nr:unnamed protein product [Didymodactylos carnosus]CAF1108635.1 unnamed protein product [Didymodactylos carnosus]CAF3716483.1 unnamed protein product [Didymodactylos carnosus]CAF3873147.1 unnamed protein product [Didymodactylos carnosus]